MKYTNLKSAMTLYAVTDRSWLMDQTLYQQVEASLKGGVTFLQLREKTLCEEDFLKEACALKNLCAHYQVPFVINDNINIALASDADGVHIGQSDTALVEARKLLGQKIIGVSVRTVAQALEAEKNGADYLGVGAVFNTSTKLDAHTVDHQVLKAICQAVSIPVVAIGGIKENNIKDLNKLGIDGVALVSAIYSNNDIEAASRSLLETVKTIL